ncbi:hypothetical protein TanjilG_03731 [Lupinus angustifolius]|uniref:Uncharacterized protein n=1 Tax=Lupinus angustifolius TaxID=3871 RepID=A0A1J7H2M4_LUPAN|nr:PREDICTED: uncharacterized protein LOC109354494 [Lupinus angustifolius]XP_019452580.1 PREDICTED: uncharacterized protein LOC109354494 [Lupinus angustifolius]OIW06836.1 hypothetical protein TanjilG_03731 [Lupinus angustifolius]
MEFSEEWKSWFPIGAGGSTVPLLLHSNPSKLGPLFFNPKPNSITQIISSLSLIPSLHLPPHLLPSRFLVSSNPSSILPSTASSISQRFSQNDTVSYFIHNRIQTLNYPNGSNVVLFFPTGDNDDQVGFVMVSVMGSKLRVVVDENGDVFRALVGGGGGGGGSSSSHRILRILINPVPDFGDECNVLAYLFVTTLYSVHWFVVRHDSILDRPSVVCLGGKVFKTCSIVNACWSPHVLEETLVLLQSGELFLFDLESNSFKGTRLRIAWGDDSDENKVWVSCEFSWHPRVLIVVRSDAVFLVDLRLDECSVSCLMRIEMFRMYAPERNEQFLALSRAGPDDFYFAVASTSLLVLLDVRKPLVPVLQWVHGIDGPYYMTALSLSMLRSHSKEDSFKFASDTGFCIILGSFWNCEFNLFCYGSTLPVQNGSSASMLSKIETSFYAWELPSEINLSSHECSCGSCLLREELSKDVLPEWVDWQLKKEMVLGFGILSSNFASLLCEADEHGGFTLIRLMSSGKLELQRYHSSWTPVRYLDNCHEEELSLDRYALYPMSTEQYKFPRRFHYLKFDYLHSYASGDLMQFLTKKLKNTSVDVQDKEPVATEMHEFLSEKLNACGLGRSRSCPASSAVFKEVKLPESFHEIALRRLWADLPMELLQLAFLKYSECREVVVDQHKVALEFLAVPDLPQLPPFFLRKPSRHNNNDIVGPVIPLPVLLAVNEFRNECSDSEKGEFSIEAELSLKYKEVMQVADEIAVSAHDSMQLDDHAVSLAEDGEEAWVGSSKVKAFPSYRPVAFNCSTTDLFEEKSVYTDKVYDTFIFHVAEKFSDQTESVGEEMFDDLCPVELRFNAPVKKFTPQGLKTYNLLKKQMSNWQEKMDSYKEFCIQSRSQKVVKK